MCQFCRVAFTLRTLWNAVEYAGKYYHLDCFEKLRVVAANTGSQL